MKKNDTNTYVEVVYTSADDDFYDNRKTFRNSRKKELQEHRRRPIKNYKKVWYEHTNDYEEIDEFYIK